MAFTIAFQVKPILDITGLQFIDNSTGDETIISREVTIVKTDLSTINYAFPDNIVTSISPVGFLDKDYALEVTLAIVTNADSYNETLRFVTLGYAITARKARIKRAKIDKSILDIDAYNRTTLAINEYSMIANDRVAFSDMVGGQTALDYIAELISKEALSPFSV